MIYIATAAAVLAITVLFGSKLLADDMHALCNWKWFVLHYVVSALSNVTQITLQALAKKSPFKKWTLQNNRSKFDIIRYLSIPSEIFAMKFVSISNCKSAICMNLSDRSWSSGNAFVTGEGGLKFNSLTGPIGHSAANGSLPLRHFFERTKRWPRKLVTRLGAMQQRV